MEKNGYIYREMCEAGCPPETDPSHRERREIPAPAYPSRVLKRTKPAMIRGIPKEDVELCKQVLWQMYANRKKMCNKKDMQLQQK